MNCYLIQLFNSIEGNNQSIENIDSWYVNAESAIDAIKKVKNSGAINGELPIFTINLIDTVTMEGKTSVEPVDIFVASDKDNMKDYIFPVRSVKDIYDMLSKHLDCVSISTYTDKCRFIM